MEIKIVGIENQDYKMDNGYAFKGKKLHCIDEDTERPSLNGNVVTTIKIDDNSSLATVPVEVGNHYTAFFNQKGALAYLTPLDK